MRPENFDVVIAGFGGQGVLLMGDILAWAGMMEGYSTSFFPSYGVEMRGGTVNCIVVMTKGELYSPILGKFQNVVAMNPPSLEKFSPLIKKEGKLFFNSSLIDQQMVKKYQNSTKAIGIPLNEIAKSINAPKIINMVMLGVIIEETNIVKKKTVFDALEEYFKSQKELIEINRKGIEAGINFIRKVR